MKNHSKGFFFVLISFILVLYIFLYLTAWINATEIQEKTSSEKFNAASIEGIVAELSEGKFQQFFQISGYHAAWRINDYASSREHTLKAGSRSDEMQYYRSAFFGLVKDGTSSDFEYVDGSTRTLDYASDEKQVYSFGGWVDNLNKTLNRAGLHLAYFDISDERIDRIDPVTFNVSMNISFFVEDDFSTISIARTFRLNRVFNVTGFNDPMISRETYMIFGPAKGGAKWQIYYSNTTPEQLWPERKSSGTQGQDFFYGPMVPARSATSPAVAADPSRFILVGNFSEIMALGDQYYTQFGAYIVTNDPVMEVLDPGCDASETETFNPIQYSYSNTSGCSEFVGEPQTKKPYAVIPNFDISSYSGPDYPSSLIIAQHSADEVESNVENKLQPAYAYNIEPMRDALVCTYFVHTNRSPSYVQRLTKDALNLNSTDYGIETFLLGRWAGGDMLGDFDNRSRVDIEFFKGVQGIRIRGMPGCKNAFMCSVPVGESSPLGHFALSVESLKLYEDYRNGEPDNIERIDCGDDRARCILQ